MREFRESVIGAEFPDSIIRSHAPLLAVRTKPGDGLSGTIHWYLCAPLVVEDRVVGVLGIASQRRDFDIAAAVKVLFPVAV